MKFDLLKTKRRMLGHRLHVFFVAQQFDSFIAMLHQKRKYHRDDRLRYGGRQQHKNPRVAERLKGHKYDAEGSNFREQMSLGA